MRKLEYVSLVDVLPADKNPKEHHIDGIENSIGRFGYVSPMVMDDRTGKLVAGHGRLKTLLGMYTRGEDPPGGIVRSDTGQWLVPVVRGWSSRSDQDASGYLLADNRQTELGGWDEEALADLLREIAEVDPSLPDIVGWDDDAMSEILHDDHGDGFEDNPSLPVEAAKPLQIRFGCPPFDVFDARQGYWRDRKRQWLSLGFRSEVGRGTRLARHGVHKADPDFYTKKSKLEEQLGRILTTAEYLRDYYELPDTAVCSGTSVFDPVLCELAYRWFSPRGGTVLDPFAGGSVRGIVAAVTGRKYVGVDLSSEQVGSNREQVEQILKSVEPGISWVTPICQHGDYLVKRDDLFTVGGVSGGKARTALAIMSEPGVTGVVTAGQRHSQQTMIVAAIAKKKNLPCHIHTPEGDTTPEIDAAIAYGAEIIRQGPGYGTVLDKAARVDADTQGWAYVPLMLECDTAVEMTSKQTVGIGDHHVNRIVVPIGSGMSLAGILRGLAEQGLNVPVLGVQVGSDPSDRLDKYAPGWRDKVDLVVSAHDYSDHVDADIDGLVLDPTYEGKCLEFMEPGDLLWIVGRGRASERLDVPTDTIVPEWIHADSAVAIDHMEAESADFIFTCPPYYDLESYSDDPADLSAMTYDQFDVVYEKIIMSAARVLRENRFAVIVTGDARDKHGIMHDLRGETIRAAQLAGLHYVSGAVLITVVGSAASTSARTFKANRGLGRVHQDVLVFVKGDRKRAAEACGDVELEFDL